MLLSYLFILFLVFYAVMENCVGFYFYFYHLCFIYSSTEFLQFEFVNENNFIKYARIRFVKVLRIENK